MARQKDLKVIVLQNGVEITSTRLPLEKSSQVRLSNKWRDSFSVSNHSLPKKSITFQTKKNKAYVSIDIPVGGIVKSENVEYKLENNISYPIKFGIGSQDFGIVTYKDLSICYRVMAREQEKLSSNRKPKKQGLIKLIMPEDKWQMNSLAVGVLLSILLVGSFSLGLTHKDVKRVEEFTSLNEKYILPFVNPIYIENAPEALKFNYHYNTILQDTIHYYQSITELFLDEQISSPKFLYSNSILHAKKNALQKVAYFDQLYDNKTLDIETYATDSKTNFIALPSTFGHPIDQQVDLGIRKIRIHNQTLSSNLSDRRQVTAAFRDDKEYEFSHNFRPDLEKKDSAQDSGKSLREQTESILNEAMGKKIERTVYSESVKLAYKALRHRIKTGPQQANKELATIILIDEKLQGVSPFKEHETRISEDKIAALDAIEYGKPRQRKPRKQKIVSGTINAEMVERVIVRNQYELKLCFEAALRSDPKLAGNIDWKWSINTQGKAGDFILLKTTIQNDNFIRCVRSKIAAWPFPAARSGPVRVSRSFVFSPESFQLPNEFIDDDNSAIPANDRQDRSSNSGPQIRGIESDQRQPPKG